MSDGDRISMPGLLGLDTFEIDQDQPHIVLDTAICATCGPRPCLSACPAQRYVVGSGGEMTVDTAGCLECGTCLVVCQATGAGGIVHWTYPRGTYGVSYGRG